MNTIELKERNDINDNIKLKNSYTQFGALIAELRKRELPDVVAEYINEEVKSLNELPTGVELIKALKKKQTKIIQLVEKQLKVVPKNYYRNLWLALGLSAFGLPIGVAIALSLGNMGLLGIGFPFGIAMGLAVGAGMDKKALNEGRQLDIEIR
ncbi:hypothetical protein Q765_08495 [Flavobacterium rivuli WB 3.3-2 = DSM 21788]|uniref:Uncharacterized protein n=1 Tax=Flavobacterium rivuli WB 3.3-2 = DSM 21788 TaxID=1121895 RepID=A0A0A2M2W0_9FLAO|nr:hypothetical protein [Flavobacterium rivuli]KGO86987.1 hypothetical protein Q765_08495 [Flavobacterium rivuli WB 3.3-2 = DSM 21788]